jgi:hypothetical protein
MLHKISIILFQLLAPMALSKELKEAVLAMPASEKDKLLIRLLGKHEDLQRQLEFQLLEFGTSLEGRRNDVREIINRLYAFEHYSPGYLMMDMRSVNAYITDHVKITKDKYGEVELTLYLLNMLFEKQFRHIEKYSNRSDTLASYVAKRADFVVKKLEKLHPDIQFEFVEDINLLLQRLHAYAPAHYAREMGIRKTFDY